jgi:hypothetical protein
MMEQNHIESQVTVLADDPQVWDPPSTQDGCGSVRDHRQAKATDTDFWKKAVNKEMAKVKIA